MKFLILTLLFSFTSIAFSQDEDRKRPSWSEDLPERTNQPDLEFNNKKPEPEMNVSREDLFGDDNDVDPDADRSLINESNEEEAKKVALEAKKLAAEEAEKLAAKEAKKLAAEEAKKPESNNTDNLNYNWEIIKKAAPDYPKSALRSQKEGWVDVKFILQPDGTISDTSMLNSSKGPGSRAFIQPALSAVKKWRYSPPSEVGITTPLEKTVRVEFKLQ